MFNLLKNLCIANSKPKNAAGFIAAINSHEGDKHNNEVKGEVLYCRSFDPFITHCYRKEGYSCLMEILMSSKLHILSHCYYSCGLI